MRRSLMRQFIALSLAIVLVVCIVFFVMLHSIYSYSMKFSSQTQRNNHQQVAYRLEEYFDSIEKAAYSMCYSPTTQVYIQSDFGERISQKSNLISVYSSTYQLLDSLIGIAVFNPAGSYIASSGSNVFHLDGLPDEMKNISSNLYTGLYQEGSGPQVERDCFGMLTPVYSLQPGSRLLNKRIGTAVLTFSTSYVRSLISSGDLPSDYFVFLTDSENRILAASSPAAAQYFQNHTWEKESPAAKETTLLPGSGWTLYSVMPHSILADDLKPMIILTYLTGGIFILLIALLLMQLHRQILKPIHDLSEFMTSVASHESSERFIFHSKNELGQMTQVFNSMLDTMQASSQQLRQSESDRFETELSRKQMEILAYRNQINPHFLYNTLDCIRGIALYYQANEIAEISESLSTMFHYAVKGENYATVAQEIAHVREYANIIGYRFMNRIRIITDVQPEAEPVQILKLSMQPLVENAVFHGLEKKRGAGQINLSVHLQDSCIRITVTDDGIGISEEKLRIIHQNLLQAGEDAGTVPDTERSIGLANIARRLHLFYGAASSLSLQSVPGQGTTVELSIPLK